MMVIYRSSTEASDPGRAGGHAQEAAQDLGGCKPATAGTQVACVELNAYTLHEGAVHTWPTYSTNFCIHGRLF